MIIINILKSGNRLDFTTEKDERHFHLLELTKGPTGTRQSILHVWASYLPNICHNFIESQATYAKHSTSTEFSQTSTIHPNLQLLIDSGLTRKSHTQSCLSSEAGSWPVYVLLERRTEESAMQLEMNDV
jgi:hypothetical protein